MKSYIVTGGAGHIGSHVVDALISRGDEVLVVDDLSSGKLVNLNPSAGLLECSVMDALQDSRLKSRWDGIFHLAAFVNVRMGSESPRVSSDGGANLTVAALEAARVLKIPKFVFVSSVVVEYNPRIPYGIEKEMGERYCRYYQERFGTDISIIRLHSVYGSPRHDAASGNVIPSFIQQKKMNGKIQISGDGSQVRDFVYYTDVAAAILEAENRRGLAEVGTCRGHSILEVARCFDCPIEFTGRAAGEVDLQVCRKSDYPTKVSFEEGIRRVLQKLT
jgi:UDP-glucose 4-epimerase